MLPFKQIRSAIARGLNGALGIPVIEMNGGGDMPEGCFMTYDFPEGFGGARGQPIITQQDGKQHRRETVTFTVSFNSYADLTEDSIGNAMLARDWFKTAGHEQLKNTLDVIVVDIGDIRNRDINIGEEWERRQGFDVDFRATDLVITGLTDWIETVTI